MDLCKHNTNTEFGSLGFELLLSFFARMILELPNGNFFKKNIFYMIVVLKNYTITYVKFFKLIFN